MVPRTPTSKVVLGPAGGSVIGWHQYPVLQAVVHKMLLKDDGFWHEPAHITRKHQDSDGTQILKLLNNDSPVTAIVRRFLQHTKPKQAGLQPGRQMLHIHVNREVELSSKWTDLPLRHHERWPTNFRIGRRNPIAIGRSRSSRCLRQFLYLRRLRELVCNDWPVVFPFDPESAARSPFDLDNMLVVDAWELDFDDVFAVSVADVNVGLVDSLLQMVFPMGEILKEILVSSCSLVEMVNKR